MTLDLDKRQRAMLREMGIRVWQPPAVAPPALEPAMPATPAAIAMKIIAKNNHSESLQALFKLNLHRCRQRDLQPLMRVGRTGRLVGPWARRWLCTGMPPRGPERVGWCWPKVWPLC